MDGEAPACCNSSSHRATKGAGVVMRLEAKTIKSEAFAYVAALAGGGAPWLMGCAAPCHTWNETSGLPPAAATWRIAGAPGTRSRPCALRPPKEARTRGLPDTSPRHTHFTTVTWGWFMIGVGSYEFTSTLLTLIDELSRIARRAHPPSCVQKIQSSFIVFCGFESAAMWVNADSR